MARISYSSKKNKFVLLGLIVCIICLLFFSTTFALLAFQESFSVDLTLGYISLNEVGKASLDVSQHEVGDLVCSDGISFVKDTDTRNFYARVNIYYSSNDDLTMSNRKYLALLNGMIEPASYDDYSWSERFVDSYYLTTTYGGPYEIDEFVEDDYRFYFLDSLTFGQNAEEYLKKFDRPEHIYLNVEIQAIQSEYLYEFIGGETKDENYIPTFDDVKTFFVEHFGDINRQDYQLVLYHDIYNELFDIGFVEYGEKLFEPPQLQFEIGNFKHWCTSPDPCKYACSGGSCTCGSLNCLCANAYDFNLLVKGKLYLYARYDVEMGDIEELYLFEANDDGTYSISQNFKKNNNGTYMTPLTPAPTGGIVLPKIYNYARVTQIKYIAPKDSNGNTLATPTSYAFGNNTQLTGVAISNNIEIIADNAFRGCSNIAEVAMFEGLTSVGAGAFYGCSKIVNISVPDSVNSIGNQAFGNCSGIQIIELPFVGGEKEGASEEEGYFGYIFNSSNTGGMKKITKKTGISISATDVVKVSKTNPGSNYEKYNEKSYYYNTAFQKTDEVYTLYQIKEVAGSGSYTRYIPPNLTTVTINGGIVHDYAFSDDNGLESIKTINFGKNIKSIGNFACYKISVEYLTISGCLELTEIKDFAFFGCENLLSVKIENNPVLTRIGKGAFARLNIVDNISLEGCEALTTLGAAAFAQCPELRAVYFPTGITTISDFAFFACKKLELPMFSEKLEKIGHFAFYECETLTRINLTGTIINEIGHYAFDMCTKISEVKFSRELKKVGNYSFAHCELIGSFNVPEVVEYMGTGCIAGCYKLSELVLPFVGKVKETAAGAYTPGAAVQSSSEKYNLFSIIFSTQEIFNDKGKAHTEFTLDVSSELHEVATYDSEFYNNNTSGYSITLQSYYQQSWKDAANKTFYGVHTYLFAFIPKNLSRITVLSGHIRVGAFSGLKTVREFIIEDGVTGIDRQAFVDAYNVERMTVPFVGTTPEPTEPSILTLFGAIFDSHATYMDYDTGFRFISQDVSAGSNDVEEIYRATQHYGESATQTKDYNIPRDLSAIIILGGKLQYGCLSGIEFLKSVAVEEGCKGLGQNMFLDCLALSSLTLGLITDDTDIISPSTSTLLGYYFGATTPDTYYYVPLTQRYKDGDSVDLTTWIPKSLTSITINGGDILYGACMNLKTINSVLVTGNAKSIGKYAFYNTTMTSLTVQNLRSLTTFGDYAFAMNTSLNRVIFANNQLLVNLSNHLFDGCTSITKIEYSGSPKLSSAQNSTFANCSAIADIRNVLPETVTTIGDYCFENCSGLEEIILYKTLISAGRYAFLNCGSATKITYLNRNFIEISEGMFKGCGRLGTIQIGEFIETIGPFAFSRCSGATSIAYNELVTHLPYRCFEYCKGLTQLVIGSNIYSMEAAVFSHCENATSILYNDKIKKIPRQTFEHCYKLKISFGSTVTKFEDYAFAFAARSAATPRTLDFTSSVVTSFGKGCFAFAGLTAINLSVSRNITYGDYCFYENRSCTSITFPSKTYMSVTPRYFFANNTALTSISIPEGIKLGESCFEYCKGLTQITFHTSITEINNRAFRACIGLTTLTVPYHIQKIKDEAFAGVDSFKHLFYDPDGDLNTPYYGDLADYICMNEDNTRYILEDHIIRYDTDPDYNNARIPVYESHLDERGLKDWFNWYFGSTTVSICQSAKDLISTILNGVNGDPLGMKITNINFETWSDWKTISGTASKLTEIGKKAFYMNSALTSLHFPRSLQIIGESAFASYNTGATGMKLDYVIVPYDSSLTSIAKLAFSNTRVYQLHFVNKSSAPTLSHANAFAYGSASSYTGVLGVYVQNGIKNAFTGASGWSSLSNYIYDCWNGAFDKSGALPFNIYGTGGSSSPYNIFHANQLTYIGEQTSFGNQRYSDKHFGIVRDLYLPTSAQTVTKKYNWRPIAYHSGASFDGTLKGVDVNNGAYTNTQRTINGLTIKALATDSGLFSSSGNYSYFGLVGFAGASSVFQYITLSGVTFSTGSIIADNSGALVASCHGKILNCTAAGSISVSHNSGTCRVGGICGGSYIDGGGGTLEMTNCTNKVNISSTPASYFVAGGIVAYSPYTTAAIIKNCVNEGEITGGSTNTARNYVGGIMGEVNGHVTIESCTNKANITINSVVPIEVGGIAGRMWANATMKACKVESISITGTVSVDSSASFVGGYVGVTGDNFPENGGAPSNIFDANKISFDTTSVSLTLNAGTTSKSYVGGIVGGTTHYLRNLTCYNKVSAKGRHVGLITSMSTSYAAVTGCTTSTSASLTNSFSGTSYTGGIVGYISSSSGGTPNNTNNAPITGNSHVGGHYGYMYISGTTLTAGGDSNSRHNKGTIKGVNAGGIAGYVDINSSTITGFRNQGTVTSSDNSGGIIGRLVRTNSNGYITYCYNYSAISSTGSCAGGIIASMPEENRQTNFYIQYCENSGAIGCTGSYPHTGGIIGYFVNSYEYAWWDTCYTGAVYFFLDHCKNTSTSITGVSTSGRNRVGGIAGEASATLRYCSSSFNPSGTASYAGSLVGYSFGWIRCWRPFKYTYGYFCRLQGCSYEGSALGTGDIQWL